MLKRTTTLPSESPKKSDKREALLTTAEALFDGYGFHGTGVDLVVQRAEVARMTFYKHFPTKNALVRAVIERRDDRFWQAFEKEAAERVEAGEDPILCLFDVLGDWLKEATHGCLLLRALGEFSNHDLAVAGDAAFRKRKMGPFVQAVLERQGIADAEARSWDLVLLMEGAVALGPVVGGPQAAGQAKHAAAALLRAWSLDAPQQAAAIDRKRKRR